MAGSILARALRQWLKVPFSELANSVGDGTGRAEHDSPPIRPPEAFAATRGGSARPFLAAILFQGTGRGVQTRGSVPEGSCVIVQHLQQHETNVSRRTLLRGLASTGSMLALGGCAGLAATGTSFDASSLAGDSTLIVTTTRKRVNGGRARPWFGSERASTLTLARAKLVPPGDSRLSLAAVGLGDWSLDAVEPVPGEVSDVLAQAGGGGRRPGLRAWFQADIRDGGARRRAPLRWHQVPRPDGGVLVALQGWDCSTTPMTGTARCGHAMISNACSIPSWRLRAPAASTSSRTAWEPC